MYNLSNKSLNTNETARRYAKALQLISVNESDKNSLKKEFDSFIDSYKNLNEMRVFFNSPLINPMKRTEVINKVLSSTNLSESFSNFLITLAKNGKLFLIVKIHNEYVKLLDISDGILTVSVTTTEKLEKEQEKKIIDTIGNKLNTKIRLNKYIDPNIIGGIIIKINSVMIDNSIKSKLLDYNFNERVN